MLNGGEAASILLAFMLLVFAADGLSGWLRARSTPRPPAGFAFRLAQPARCRSDRRRLIASFRFLDIGFGELLTADAARSIGEFVAGFFPPDLSAEWLGKVGRASGRRWPSPSSAPCSPPSPACSRAAQAARAVQLPAQYAALGAGTGVGHHHRAGRPRPFAGALALALHTAGVLGRLYAEALANAPAQPAQALRLSGAGNGLAFLYGTLPGAAPQLIAYTLYRWEMNIRMAAILGFVGAGGLGQLLYFELSLFHHAQASTSSPCSPCPSPWTRPARGCGSACAEMPLRRCNRKGGISIF
jgi:phosphonate transport system permease protein